MYPCRRACLKWKVYIVNRGHLFWGCTSGGVCVPCICSHARWQLPSAIQIFVVCQLWCMQRMSSAFNSDCLLILHTRCRPYSVSDFIIRAIGYSVMWVLRQRWWSNGTALVSFCFRLHYPNDGYSAMWMLRQWSWANVTALASLRRGAVCARTPTESGRQEVRVNN